MGISSPKKWFLLLLFLLLYFLVFLFSHSNQRRGEKMTWSYSGDPSTSDKDMVRLLIGDVDEDDQLLSDEEIEAVLAVYTNIHLASSVLAESISGMFSRLADKSIGDYSISLSQMSEQYRLLADRLRRYMSISASIKAQPFAGGISRQQKTEAVQNEDRVTPSFKRGMNENKRARVDAFHEKYKRYK